MSLPRLPVPPQGPVGRPARKRSSAASAPGGPCRARDATYQTGNAGLGIAPGTLAGAPAAATVSAGFAAAGIDALVDAGAQNISFLAGNTAILPEVALLPDPTVSASAVMRLEGTSR